VLQLLWRRRNSDRRCGRALPATRVRKTRRKGDRVRSDRGQGLPSAGHCRAQELQPHGDLWVGLPWDTKSALPAT